MSHAIHDFTAKLRQPQVIGSLETYIQWRKDMAEARTAGEPAPEAPPSSPISINLDLTVACNFRCTHCIDWDILNTKHRLAEKELRESLGTMRERGLRSVILIGGGEPTLYPGFVGFVQYLKQELGLQVAIVSNGSRGDRLLEIAPLLEEGDWVRLSLDSGSNDLFVAMHKPQSKSTTLDEICSWIPRIKAANPAPRIGFSYVIIWSGASREENDLNENIHEIRLAAERAKASSFDYISFKPVLERQEDGAEMMDPSKTAEQTAAVVARIRAEVTSAEELADETFDVFVSTNLRLLEQGTWQEYTRQPRTCHMQALRQVLTPTGLYNCPAHRGVDKAVIGGKNAYLDEQQVQVTSNSLAQLLENFDASKECAQVTCLYNRVNWWIEERIAEPGTAQEVLKPGDESGDTFL